jgi:hypothetical protein
MAAPLALRLPRRPLFLAFAQLLASAAFKPYPSAADAAPWMALAPLLAAQLSLLRLPLFFGATLSLLAVLCPAMAHQWLMVDSANSNFFYAVTLLLGAWHVAAAAQALALTLRVERAEAGKSLLSSSVDGGREGGGDEDGGGKERDGNGSGGGEEEGGEEGEQGGQKKKKPGIDDNGGAVRRSARRAGGGD